jgi:hypothetical protein
MSDEISKIKARVNYCDKSKTARVQMFDVENNTFIQPASATCSSDRLKHL